jgi:hypothetical protein
MPSEMTAEEFHNLPSPSDFEQAAKRFRDERNIAWDEFLDLSCQAGYNIKNTIANRSLFMAGFESGKETKASCRCGHTKTEHKSLDSRPFGKWNCTFCQCKEYEKL